MKRLPHSPWMGPQASLDMAMRRKITENKVLQKIKSLTSNVKCNSLVL
jgi:hypothetical protein